jgi:hypothetical protein
MSDKAGNGELASRPGAAAGREFGEGPLSRAAALVYTLFVVELLFVVTGAPGLALVVLLGREAGNLPLVALCAVPVGPALSAMLYALQQRRSDLTDLKPVPAFLRGYRANLGAALMVWVPLLGWLTVVAVTLANLGVAGVPGWWAGLLVLVAVAVTLWAANAMVIVSLFAFRFADVARLAGYFLTRRPAVTIGNLCLLIVAVAVTVIWSEVVLVLLASVFALTLLRTARPLVNQVRRDFTS